VNQVELNSERNALRDQSLMYQNRVKELIEQNDRLKDNMNECYKLAEHHSAQMTELKRANFQLSEKLMAAQSKFDHERKKHADTIGLCKELQNDRDGLQAQLQYYDEQ